MKLRVNRSHSRSYTYTRQILQADRPQMGHRAACFMISTASIMDDWLIVYSVLQQTPAHTAEMHDHVVLPRSAHRWLGTRVLVRPRAAHLIHVLMHAALNHADSSASTHTMSKLLDGATRQDGWHQQHVAAWLWMADSVCM